jgi:predicted alpha/beta-hydrolase family hydrolase
MPLLVALAEAFAAAGVNVLRCDLAFRIRRPSGPPSGSAKLDQEGLRRAAELLRRDIESHLSKSATDGAPDVRIFIGGQSYGGRQASMLMAEDERAADGLLLLSYPLHPPGKPEQLRTKHFSQLRVPALFVQGTKDPFGSIEEMESAVKLVKSPTKLVPVEGGGHGLLTKKNKDDVVEAVVREMQWLVAGG